ncbi:MAG: nucleoside triphosphate pyrophosphohydrolase [bacterium]
MSPAKKGFEKALDVMARLRAPDGCPWDRDQDHHTLKPYLIEEAYEVIEAIDSGDPAKLREELGDLLLQVIFHCQLARERGLFDASEVAEALADKIVTRHPHVFGDNKADSTDEVLRNWEISKRNERAALNKKSEDASSILDGVPSALPSLQRAQRLQGKAARVGFDWPDANGAAKKLEEEWRELKEAVARGDSKAQEREMGDFLFATVNYARKLGINSEESTRSCVERFTERFRHIEASLRTQGLSPEQVSLEELDRLWDEAKSFETKNSE